jgi:hypothetical protein
MKFSISENCNIFEKVGLWHTFSDCVSLCLGVKYTIANSYEMNNTSVVPKKDIMARLALSLFSETQDSNLVANKRKRNED